MKKIIAFAFIPLFFAGCSLFLPSGEPPQGNILNNTPQNSNAGIRKPGEAVDYLISSLTMILLEKCPGEKIFLGADRNSADMAFRILHESGKITGNTMTFNNAEWVVKSTLAGDNLNLSLEHKGTAVWNDSVRIAL